MVPEAPLEGTEHGLAAAGEGWYVLNAREARWLDTGPLGMFCHFEGQPRFSQLGINVSVLQPGQPLSMYHWEDDQEDFLVLAGEAIVLVEGEERPLRQWDLVHCPPRTRHSIVGAGEAPCVVLAIGARTGDPDAGGYTVEAAALRHGAGVERETREPTEAYASFPGPVPTAYRSGLLPDLGATP
jgi:uncharacterized cupin superfamily protein